MSKYFFTQSNKFSPQLAKPKRKKKGNTPKTSHYKICPCEYLITQPMAEQWYI